MLSSGGLRGSDVGDPWGKDGSIEPGTGRKLRARSKSSEPEDKDKGD